MALLERDGYHRSNLASARAVRPDLIQRARLPAFLTGLAASLRSGNDNKSRADDIALPAELDCLRKLLPPDVLQAAALRGLDINLGADQALIHRDGIEEDTYVALLAKQLGIQVHPLARLNRRICTLNAEQLSQAARTSIVPLQLNGELIFVIAPRNLGARGLIQLRARNPALLKRIRLTTSHDFDRFITSQGDMALGHAAANGLRDGVPDLSAAPKLAGEHWRSKALRTCRIGGFAALIVLPPLFAEGIWTSALASLFLGFAWLRVIGSFVPRLRQRKRARQSDADLPIYTVIVALYREASSVAPLMRAISAFDYPREKLDVLLVTEADDSATREAIARLGPMPHLRVLTAPAIKPQTKPKALNYALSFARGSFVAVFDAEDRPQSGQLRAALDAFHVRGHEVACVQAALCIDNGSESLISRMFTAEYAGQFDIFLPGLAALRLPLPLGGSSNHFRTGVLRRLGGWDAYNVTEDADLGIRLARYGYRSATFASTTYEEAPIRFGAWLCQRSRWMKGWMQTWSVHMRNPRQLWRDAGPRGFVAINLIVGGNVVTALAYPTLIGEFLAFILTGSLTGAWSGFLDNAQMPLHVAAIASGYLSAILIGLLGLAYRRQLHHGWILLLAPLYWCLLSVAAWRALWQLLRDPYRWEKTEHGVSRRSTALRQAQR